MKQKVVLAYSGGLDTSVIVHWLTHVKNYDVICFVADVGQKEDFEYIKTKALATGATKVCVDDLKQEFIEQYIFKALQANSMYEGQYLLGTALARPLIAAKQVACAKQEGATILAHGATGKGNDQVRFELAYAYLMPQAQVISPWKDPEFLALFKGRSDLIAYANKHNIPVTSTLQKPYSIDENIMHTSYESGVLEDPSYQPDEAMFQKTVSLEQAPQLPAEIEIHFVHGVPCSVTNHADGTVVTGPLPVFEYLNKLAGAHGVGRVDMVENRFVGIKSRGVYESPAATVLWKAHKDLESITLDKQVAHLKEVLSLTITQLMYDGFWFSPEMDFLMPCIQKSQEKVDGIVLIKLYKGNVIVCGRSSAKSLYNQAIASMDEVGGYDQTDAKGFITIQALRLKCSSVRG